MSDEVEQWRAAPGLPGYEASNLGRVRSLRRKTPRVLIGNVGPCGFRTTLFRLEGRDVCFRFGTVVALAWLGPAPKGAEVRRLDGNPLNDRLENLAYGTAEDVVADHAARARREEAAGAPTHCDCGESYADLWIGAFGARLCPPCRRRDDRARLAALGERRRLRSANGSSRTADRIRSEPRPPVNGWLTRAAKCLDCDEVLTITGVGGLPLRCPDHLREKRGADARRRRAATKSPRHALCRDCGELMEVVLPGPLPSRCPLHRRQAESRDGARRKASSRARRRHGVTGAPSVTAKLR